MKGNSPLAGARRKSAGGPAQNRYEMHRERCISAVCSVWPSAALLAGILVCGLPFCAEAQPVQFIAPVVAQTARQAVAEPRGDVIEFVDGSMLHGQLRQMDADRGLAWENPDAKNPIHFQPGHIDFIRFARADAMNLAPTCHLQFANGDDLFGSITSLDSERLGLSTWFGGAMTVPRTAIRTITLLSSNYSIVYEGPYDGSGWVFGIANMPQSWRYHDGWFTSEGTGSMGREMGLTNSSTVEFDLHWSGALELEMQLYTDTLETDGIQQRFLRDAIYAQPDSSAPGTRRGRAAQLRGRAAARHRREKQHARGHPVQPGGGDALGVCQ